MSKEENYIITEPDTLTCPHCKTNQGEHPRNYISDTIYDIDCDECGKHFYFEEVYYIRCSTE